MSIETETLNKLLGAVNREFLLACVTLYQEEEIMFLSLFKITKLLLPFITLIINWIGVQVCF